MPRVRAAVLVGALFAAGCSGSDPASIATGENGEVATTAPLAMPPELQVPAAVGDTPIATTEPLVPPEPSATAAPEATAAPTATAAPPPTVASPEPTVAPEPTLVATAVPAAESSEPTPVPVTPVPATPVPATAVPVTPVPATPVPATPVPATPVPATAVPSAGGAVVDLGDFQVVNLSTRQNQNISALAPSGATMLWFWAPH